MGLRALKPGLLHNRAFPSPCFRIDSKVETTRLDVTSLFGYDDRPSPAGVFVNQLALDLFVLQRRSGDSNPMTFLGGYCNRDFLCTSFADLHFGGRFLRTR